MRGSWISSLDTLDEEQLLGDICTMTSFFVKHGYEYHDPHSWPIMREFKMKVCLISSLELLDYMHTVAAIPCRVLTWFYYHTGITCSFQSRQNDP